MRASKAYEYAVLRVVPDVVREEFINVGVILYCASEGSLEVRIVLDEGRLLAICSTVDLELVREHLTAVERVCRGGKEAGPIGELSTVERFRWLVSPRNTILQTSAAHAGMCEDPRAALEHLVLRSVVVKS